MKKRITGLIAILLSLLMAISSLPATGITVEAAARPVLAKKSASIVIGGTSKITVKNVPRGAKVSYLPAKKGIVTVSKKGSVKGIKDGSTKITVSIKKNSKTTKLIYKVTVKKPTLFKNKVSLTLKKSAILSIKNRPKKAKYTWTSDRPKIAAVNKNGAVTGKAKGTATIKVKIATAKKVYNFSCKVTVKPGKDKPKKPTYTVTFNSSGGSAVDTQTIISDEYAAKPADPEREDHIFAGWYTSSAYSQEFDFIKTKINKNTELFARWVDIADTTDSDGDGLTDPAEEYFGTDPAKKDTDNDGLTDYFEVSFSYTDPLMADTDGNGVPDAQEDPDEDGLTNLEEQANSGDPLVADTDGDGLPDKEELAHGTRLDIADTDGDGLSDYDELYIFNLDPLLQTTDGLTPDAERTFPQTLENENIAVSDSSEVHPSLEVNTAGNINTTTTITESSEDALTGNKAIVGPPIEVLTSSDLSPGAELTFELENPSVSSYENTELICQYKENEGFAPMETSSTENTVSTTITESGTYFVLNTETFMLNLGIDLESIESGEMNAAASSALEGGLVMAGTEIPHLSIEERRSMGNLASDDESSMPEIDAPGPENDFDPQTIPDDSPDFSAAASDSGKDTKAQADIVFVIDATGSMKTAINNVATNVNNFADKLVNDYKINANFSVIEFQDIIEDGLSTTVQHKNGASSWWNAKSVDVFKDEINSITAKDGGDWPETPIDGLAMARDLTKSSSTKKFYVLITDAPYKEDNRYGIANMDEMIDLLIADGVHVSVITDNWDYDAPVDEGKITGYRRLYQETSGVLGYIYDSNFSAVLETIADMIGDASEGCWITLDTFETVRLDAPITSGSPTDTDGDGIPDCEEITDSYVIDLKKYVSSIMDFDYYLKNGGEQYITVYSYKSRPDKADTDGDGLDDKEDPDPRNWNVCDRDLAMCAAMCYEDGTAAKAGNRFYLQSEIEGDRNGGESGESYYFYGLAHISEMADEWKVVDYSEDSRTIKIDNFSATTYKNGKNIIISYRGTNETLEWLDNVVCYGLANYHTEESQARSYARKIVSRYPGCSFYITGHSLGGYLAQIGTAELVQKNMDSNLVRTAYFNGIGVAFNPTIAITKFNDKLTLYDFSHDFLSSNHKLISYAIKGDWVHNLGIHQGDTVEYFADNRCVAHHMSLVAAEYKGLSFWQAFGKAFGSSLVDTGALALSTVAASPTTIYYYGYYGIPDFIRFTWATHETDSFFSHLAQGTRDGSSASR